MYKKILPNAKNAIKRFFGAGGADEQVNKIYKEREYLEAYSQHTDLRVGADPKKAIGGRWEEMGQLQFDFMINAGLQPQHKMMDIGCGTLRGGRHFIKYLNRGNYYGIDISSKAIVYAEQLVQAEGLSEKGPHLLFNEKKDLKFLEFTGETFDYILAQSVFTHLKSEHIKECFENIGRVMHDSSVFFFTYNRGEQYQQTDLKDFCYLYSFFESLATQYGFKLQDRSHDYTHPRQQCIAELRKR